MYADGDTVIVFFDAKGPAKDGKPYTNTYAWFLDFHGGKIVNAPAFFDSIAFNDLWTRLPPATAMSGTVEQTDTDCSHEATAVTYEEM